MVNWQITLTTIHCEAVDDEVTLMVYKDGSARCSGVKIYSQPSGQAGVAGSKRQAGTSRACQGADCSRLAQYRDGLFAREKPDGT